MNVLHLQVHYVEQDEAKAAGNGENSVHPGVPMSELALDEVTAVSDHDGDDSADVEERGKIRMVPTDTVPEGDGSNGNRD